MINIPALMLAAGMIKNTTSLEEVKEYAKIIHRPKKKKQKTPK